MTAGTGTGPEALTFLFTDIEGSTQLLQRVGASTFAKILTDHHALIRARLDEFGGEEIDTAGDGFFAAFGSARDCAEAVIGMQRSLQSHDWPEGEFVRVRMGVHSGEATRNDTGLVGVDVHRAARVAGVAHGGQVLLSETTAALVRDGLPDGAHIDDLGSHRLKDLSRSQQIFQLSADRLNADFPPLRSLDNPELANNLPSQPASFIGRAHELAQVRALVGRTPLITLTGAGGAGKTRLALQIAAELLDGSGDGVWLVELAGVSDPSEVPDRVREVLGISAAGGPPIRDAVVSALANQRLLIILDNCEHLIEACAEIASAVLRGAPQIKLIATSREPLGIEGETIYRVPSLGLGESSDAAERANSDAVTLFRERALDQGVDLNLDAATSEALVSICERLDGMPLAIELAVARLRSMSLITLAERLDQRFRLLTGGSRSALPRQRTLEATVRWSFSLLNAEEQSLLQRLSVFAGPFDLAAAEAVCGLDDLDPWDIADLLGSLVDKSLVITVPTAETSRYRLLETIRQFAAERLFDGSPADVDVLGGAHCRHYRAFVESEALGFLGRNPNAATQTLDLDRANIRRAMEFAAAMPERVADLLVFIRWMRWYWFLVGSPESLDWLAVLDSPEGRIEGASYVHAAAVVLLDAAIWGRELDHSRRDELVSLARTLDDPAALQTAYRSRAMSHFFRGDLQSAKQDAVMAITLAREIDESFALAESLLIAHLSEQDTGPAAQALLDEGLAVADQHDHVLLWVLMLNNAGVVATLNDEIAAGRTYLLRAWEHRDAVHRLVDALTESVATIRRLDGDYAEAEAMLLEVFAAGRRSGMTYHMAHAVLGLALVACDQDGFEQSLALHACAQAIAERAGQHWLPGYERWRVASLARIREALGEEAVQSAAADAQNLSVIDAVAAAATLIEGG